MTNDTTGRSRRPDFTDREQGTIIGNLVFGLKIMASELKWLGLRGARAFEIRQMNKRLTEEYAALGRAVADKAAANEALAERIGEEYGPSAATAFKQVAFLKEEITFLEEERAEMRSEFMKKRDRDLGINDREDQ